MAERDQSGAYGVLTGVVAAGGLTYWQIASGDKSNLPLWPLYLFAIAVVIGLGFVFVPVVEKRRRHWVELSPLPIATPYPNIAWLLVRVASRRAGIFRATVSRDNQTVPSGGDINDALGLKWIEWQGEYRELGAQEPVGLCIAAFRSDRQTIEIAHASEAATVQWDAPRDFGAGATLAFDLEIGERNGGRATTRAVILRPVDGGEPTLVLSATAPMSLTPISRLRRRHLRRRRSSPSRCP